MRIAVAARVVASVLLTLWGAPASGSSRWGADYFPNVPLVTHEGKTVRFFDDLIKDKVVAINFVFTSCTKACPLETARLANVYRLLGDRVGRDVFMYSISIDPARDTPAVLKAYADKFHVGPGWSFLTGDEADITLLRKKLGLFIDEIQTDGSKDHNLSLIIGNQATGQWMKRSPMENPDFLATQLGSWLSNWKVATPGKRSYAEAPVRVRTPTPGEGLFQTRCAPCHTIGEPGGAGDVPPVGPDLTDVTRKRQRAWLARWLADPEKMLAEKDPISLELYEKYNKVLMPNLRLSEVDVNALIEYLDAEGRRVETAR